MLSKVAAFIRDNGLLVKGDKVCAALSGGADSVALLIVLTRLKDDLGITLTAIHVNHNLRGEESDRDERFCKSLCEKLGVSLKVASVDVLGLKSQVSMSLEEAARKARYEVFESQNGKIATAHNANDNLETALFNLTRGTALKGLCGVPKRRGKYVRPLLCVTRAEIEKFLNGIGQDWVTDSTNLVDDCSRNIIRHRVIPQLIKINEKAVESFVNTAEQLTEDERLIEAISKKAAESVLSDGGIKACEFNLLPEPVKGRVARALLKQNGIEPSAKKINAVKNTALTGKKENLKEGLYSHLSGDKLYIDSDEYFEKKEIKISVGESAEFFSKKVTLKALLDGEKKTSGSIDLEKVSGEIVLRNRLGGDKIRLCGRGFTSEVKKLLAQKKIPPNKRHEAVILSDDEGVIFVEGFGAAQRVQAGGDSKNAFKVIIDLS